MGIRLPAGAAIFDLVLVEYEGVRPVPVVVCAGPEQRFIGLRPCGFGVGALFRTSSVHGYGLAAPVAAAGLDGAGRVTEVAVLHPAGRLRFSGAGFVIELPAHVTPPRKGSTLKATSILGECPGG